MERLLLENVPRVGTYRGGDQCPESVPFPSCLAAALRTLGEEYPWLPLQRQGGTGRLNYANVQILAASGMAFGLLWREGWHMDNVDHMFVADPGEVIRRAFAAVGYGYELVERTGAPDDEARFRERIIASLRLGVPVLAFGVIGPPECCLVTGFDQGGEVLLGWNYFQEGTPWSAGVSLEPGGQFRKRGWFADTHSLLLIGEKQTPVDDLRETLRWAIQIARTPVVLGRHSGLAAYGAWAAQLLDDAAFQDRPEAALREQHEVHTTEVGQLAECRAWAAEFLHDQAERYPALKPHLLEAAACYWGEHDLMWKVWDLAGGHGNPEGWRQLAEPPVRRAIAQVIREAHRLEEEAVGLLERAVAE